MEDDTEEKENNSKGDEQYEVTLPLIAGWSWFSRAFASIRIFRGPTLMPRKSSSWILDFSAVWLWRRLTSYQKR